MRGQAADLVVNEISLPFQDHLITPWNLEAFAEIVKGRLDTARRKLCLDGKPRFSVHGYKEIYFFARFVT